jgi:acyl-[acyl-carrier-protein]-phospholipid O-acyltransferase/long-chain-fatty-acid--[acyl-carrier-protein] ligase
MKKIFKENRYSFLFLNITQFLGALNDNVFKLLIVFMLINIKGPAAASIILSIAGAIFVIPFLLFSAAAGVLADRHSKRNILMSMKIAEIAVMVLSVLAIFLKSEIGVYALLFFMASQSSVFGPSKYGIIPEIVSKDNVSKANGILTSLTYLAIIFGTFLAAFFTDITNKNFVLSSTFCVVIAVLGFLASLKIIKTLPKRSKKKINIRFITEIYKTLKLSYKRKFLLPSIFGAAFFLFIGGFVQLNTIPFALQSLKLTEIGGGYLFLATAIGISIGALIAGKISKSHLDLGISCASGFITSFILVFLGIFPNNLYFAVILMVFLGIFGGIFLIPFEAFIQIRSPEKRRGQVIAATSFLSFFGVLLASFFLFFISEICKLSAAKGFLILGAVTFVFNFINTGRLSELFLPYFVKHFLKHFYKIEIEKLPEENSVIFIEDSSWAKALTLFSEIEDLKIVVLGRRLKNFPYYNALSDSMFIISKSKYPLFELKKLAEKFKSKKTSICILLKTSFDREEIYKIFKNYKSILLMKTEKKVSFKRILGFKIKKTVFKTVFEDLLKY